MTPLEQQMDLLRTKYPKASASRLPSGAHLITVPEVRLPPGWNRDQTTVLFVAPPGYPAAQPDCFWVEPVGMRLAGGQTPHGSNDSNPIPEVGQRGTWFSWHIQNWNPNEDTLTRFLHVITRRLETIQ